MASSPLASLVLTDAGRADYFRRHLPDAVVITDAAALPEMEAQFGAALIDGLLEEQTWDRWLLQRVHRLLLPGALLTLVVPPLTSLASMTDPGFLAHASKQLLLRLSRGRWPGLFLGGARRRRYHLPRLAEKLQTLGFTSVEAGAGWPGVPGSPAPWWLARRSTLYARKGSGVCAAQRRDWPDAGLHRAHHDAQSAPMRAARDRWLAEFPQYQGMKACALEPAQWHNARVLVLAPHPDDELIGSGGTLCSLLALGAEVTILQATDGSRLESLYDLPAARRKEARLEEAARVAGAMGARLILWREEDAALRCCGRTIARLASVLHELRPTHVFTPFLGDLHDDHRTLSRILAGALGAWGGAPQVLQYEVWGAVPANLYCDVTEHAAAVERLLHLYERAMRVQDFVHFSEQRNLARALELTGKPGYVEAFLTTSAAEYVRVSCWPDPAAR